MTFLLHVLLLFYAPWANITDFTEIDIYRVFETIAWIFILTFNILYKHCCIYNIQIQPSSTQNSRILALKSALLFYTSIQTRIHTETECILEIITFFIKYYLKTFHNNYFTQTALDLYLNFEWIPYMASILIF